MTEADILPFRHLLNGEVQFLGRFCVDDVAEIEPTHVTVCLSLLPDLVTIFWLKKYFGGDVVTYCVRSVCQPMSSHRHIFLARYDGHQKLP